MIPIGYRVLLLSRDFEIQIEHAPRLSHHLKVANINYNGDNQPHQLALRYLAFISIIIEIYHHMLEYILNRFHPTINHLE